MADGLARQIAGLTGDIRSLGKRIPSYQRGVVANVSPPTVIMDRDVTATPRPVADVLVPGLTVGQRVEVRVIGSRRVITSINPADNPLYVRAGPGSMSIHGGASGRATIERRGDTVWVYDISIQPGTASNGATISNFSTSIFPLPVTVIDIVLAANTAAGGQAWLRLNDVGTVQLFHYNTVPTTFLRGSGSYPIGTPGP